MRAAAIALLLVAPPALAQNAAPPCSMAPEGCTSAQLAPLVANEKPNLPPLSGEALERRTQEVSLELRCPVCQGSSVADSPSEMARNMKSSVRDLLSKGYDREQVTRIFERAYGEFIRLEPVADGFNLVVWIGPILLLLLGIFVVWRVIRPPAAKAPAPAAAPAADDAELQRYLEQARALGRDDAAGKGPN